MKTKKPFLSILSAICLMMLVWMPMTISATEEDAFEIITKEGVTTKYQTLQEVRNAMQDGDTLKLLQDYVSTPEYNFGISLDKRDITVDLNGYSIISNNNSSNDEKNYALSIKQKYGDARDNTVTIKNNSKVKQSVLASRGYQMVVSSGNSSYNQIIKLEGDIVFQNITAGEEPLGINLGSGAKLLDTESARNVLVNGGFSIKETDGQNYLYGNLANAASKSVDGNVIMVHDYVGNTRLSSGSNDVTLDLNGHTYTYTGDTSIISVNYPNVTLTLKNGKVVATNETCDGAQLIGAPNENNMNNRGLILDGVELSVPGNVYGIVTNGRETGNKVVLKDSILNVKEGAGIYFPSTGEVTIANSIINAKLTGVQICAGTLTVTGENTAIAVTGQPQEKQESDGVIADGAAISIVSRDGYQPLEKIAIEDGTFTSADGVETLKVYMFSNNTESKWTEAKDHVAVVGGIYSSEVDTEIIKNSALIAYTSGGNTSFAVGDKAINQVIQNAKVGDTIEVLKGDVTLDIDVSGVTVANKGNGNVSVNGNEVSDTPITTGHFHKSVKIEAKEPTCVESGNIAYWYCETCGKYFADETLTKEITKEQTVLNKINHTYKDGKCTKCGQNDPKGTTPTTLEGVNTGDTTNVSFYVTLVGLGALLLVVYALMKKVHNK